MDRYRSTLAWSYRPSNQGSHFAFEVVFLNDCTVYVNKQTHDDCRFLRISRTPELSFAKCFELDFKSGTAFCAFMDSPLKHN